MPPVLCGTVRPSALTGFRLTIGALFLPDIVNDPGQKLLKQWQESSFANEWVDDVMVSAVYGDELHAGQTSNSFSLSPIAGMTIAVNQHNTGSVASSRERDAQVCCVFRRPFAHFQIIVQDWP